MFSCEQHCNIVPQYCNFDRQIAPSHLQPTRTNASWNSQKFCKQSLWLDYKEGGSTNPVAQTIWLAFPLSYNPIRGFVYKSFVNFQLAICSRRLQFAESNLPIKIAILIVGQYCNVARKRTSGFTVNICRVSTKFAYFRHTIWQALRFSYINIPSCIAGQWYYSHWSIQIAIALHCAQRRACGGGSPHNSRKDWDRQN
jgi:hypothetical protein